MCDWRVRFRVHSICRRAGDSVGDSEVWGYQFRGLLRAVERFT